jgi:protein ImuB
MFAVIHLPDFALQAALRHEAEWRTRPVALVDPALSKPLVIQMTEAARAAGITLGLTPVQALARCREVAIRHRSPVQETAVTGALLQVAYGFSPNLENTAPGTVTLDLQGLSELMEDAPPNVTTPVGTDAIAPSSLPRMRSWAGRLQAAVAMLDLEARIGVGPTPNVARHAARWASASDFSDRGQRTDGGGAPAEEEGRTNSPASLNSAVPVVVDDAAEFIATLPLSALEPSAHVADILRRWGIRNVGELLALGQAEVTERLGLEAFALFAATSARDTRPLHLVRPPERFEESFDFESPVETMEPLLFLLRRFADQLGPRLEVFGLAAGVVVLRLRLESAELIERRLRVPQPTRSADVLFRMLQTHLESLRTNAPIAGVALILEPVRPEQKQFSLFEASIRDPYQFQETLARLSALVGADRVGTPVRENSHRPDAFKLVPPDFENALGQAGRGLGELLRQVPVRRLRPAIAATVDCREEELAGASESRPVSLQCSVASGSLRVLLGPWHRSGDWWEPKDWQRTEWDVETATGRVLRLVQREGGWFVEGVLD